MVPLNSDAASEYSVLTCDSCSSSSQFESLALYSGEGDYIIVNLKTSKAERYVVRDEVYELLATRRALPNGTLEDISTYNALKNAFNETESFISGVENFSSVSSGNLNALSTNVIANSVSANGCGTGWNTYLVPDYPFENSCNQHDLCYSGSSSKYACDIQFIQNMYRDIDNLADKIEIKTLFGSVIIRALLQERAELYYLGVVKFGDTAYCSSTQNTTSDICGHDASPPEGVLLRIAEEGNYDPILHGESGSLHSSCELWQFPNGAGGYYYLELNCTWSYTP
ncbi:MULTISPECIES: hypothetical protein [Pseudoalteromonas]|uniref:hypothetical protein n=1 Tax=Pseudoalteromonas TaxID=53246 RepID=UPI0011AE899B|nr:MULTISPECIES: hypothetical protein [Pseudoalteromonas]MBH0047928.1 hypothetical protein [Pseudoalteromonas sp. NZS11_1]MBZ2192076.1 hypothetical protein [Pseudoalteromonas arctica]